MCRVLSFVRIRGPSDEESGGDIDCWRATTAEVTTTQTHTHKTATYVVADVLVVVSDCV